jgi:signal transduction histidine kinase
MSMNSQQIRAERHEQIGDVLIRDAGVVLERWRQRALAEQPTARRVHQDALLDQMTSFLLALGRSLAESDEAETMRHRIPAIEHGEQRWQTGWSLPEVVRDYQLLRLVLVEYLEETLGRPLARREVMAIGLALDEAIAASVGMYVKYREENVARIEREKAERAKDEEATLLIRQAEWLLEENRRKDEFLATLGHELRNPLGPIRNAVHVLQVKRPDAGTLEWVRDVVDRQVRHMTRLVEDLLDVSRLSRHNLELQREVLDLAEVIRTAAGDQHDAVEHAGLTLTLELPQEPVWVQGDRVRLTQVVGNLLQNAAKFTDPGGKVTIHLATDQEAKRAVVRVRDTGIGIDAEALPRVFQTFSQIEATRARSLGGLGLGLAVVKGLVELHGGEVKAASDGPGKGAEFTFWIPLDHARGLPPSAPSDAPPAVKPLRILIIDDNADSAMSEQMLLGLYGHEVAVAYSGKGGLELAREFRPEVVLCDIGLPDVDGYEVARQLRQDPATASTRLIAVTGYGSDEDRQRCAVAGFAVVLTKPVEPDELLRVLVEEPNVPGN